MQLKPKPQDSATGEDGSAPPVRAKRRRSHWRALWHTSVGTVLGLCAMAVLAVYLLVGESIVAPDWVKERIEAKAAEGLGDLGLSFSTLEFVVREGWKPRVRLRDLVLNDAAGRPIVNLSQADVSLAMEPLLRGQLQLKRVYLSGAYATLRRGQDGRIDLAIGRGATSLGGAANLPALLKDFESVLDTPQLAELTDVEMDSLTLRFEDLRQNRGWTLDGGHVEMTRDGDNLRTAAGFALLGGGASAGSFDATYTTRIGTTGAEFGISMQDIAAPDIAAQSPALTWLEVLRAPISGALRGSITSDGTLAPLSVSFQIGPGVLQPDSRARPVPFRGARSYFTYNPAEQVLSFDELSVDSDWGSGVAEGQASLQGISEGRLTEMIGQFTLSGLSLNPRGLYQEPLKIERTTADFRLKLAPFRLDLGELLIVDGDSRLVGSGQFGTDANGWKLGFDATLNQLTPERLMQLWPERAAKVPRAWVAANLEGGLLRDATFALRLSAGEAPDIYGDFNFQDTQVRFLNYMPPITGAAGQAVLDGDRFVVTATSGRVKAEEGGSVDIAGTSFIVPDVTVKPNTPAVVRFAGKGRVTAILSLLNRPPLQVLKDTPLPVSLADGTADILGTLAVPLAPRVPFSDITFHLKGKVADAASRVLVPDHMLSARSLDVTANQNGITVSGEGRIDDVAANVSWHQPIGVGVSKASRVEGDVELSQALVTTFKLGLPEGSVSGTGRGRFTLDLAPKTAPELTLTSDLKGLTLRIPQVGWTKPAATEGLLQLSGTLGAQARIDKLVLQGAGLALTGSVLNRPEGGLDRALFSSLRIDNWLDARVEMVGKGSAPPELHILGGTMRLGASDFGSTSGSSGGASGPMEVSLDRLQITDTIALTGFNGAFQTSGGLSGPFSGQVNGGTAVRGELVPRDGRLAVRLAADDAGGVFRSAGLLRQGRGGALSMTLVPAAEAGQFDGVLKVTGTRVKDAPAMAALLNAVSVIGLLDEMSGQGIQFTEVDAQFKLAPTRVTVHDSSAVGPSIGISMQGAYDVTAGRLDMQGVISPVYLINGIGAAFTRKGEGLLGFNYTLRGTPDDPQVSVNPLSALMPGGLREIFRPQPPRADGEAPRRTPRGSSDGFEGR